MSHEHQENGQSGILSGLTSELTPPDGLEDRVVAALNADGLLSRRSAPRWARYIGQAALLLLGLSVGLLIGWQPDVEDNRDRYLILLYETNQFNTERLSEEQLSQEYGVWAGKLASQNLFVDGDSLAADRSLLPANDHSRLAANYTASGFFMIRAESAEQAAQIAADCPHLRHGGHVELRRMGGS